MKNRTKKTYSQKMLKTMAIYAAVFLAILLIGLIIFWNYMDAYEDSQPENTLQSYLYNLDAKQILSHSDNLIEAVNPDIQRETDCRDVISNTLKNGVEYKYLMSQSTDNKKVYSLTCGAHTVGKVTLTAQDTGSFGLPVWTVAEETYDFSYLLNEGVKLDVPQHYKVYANGKLLSEQSIVQKDTPIDVLKDFYADYDTLPYMVTYQVGPYLGDVEITITDAEDNPVTPEEATNVAFILDNCSGAEIETLDSIASGFLDAYVRFSANEDETTTENYENVLSYIAPDSALAQRIEDALAGLKWVKNRDTEIISTTTHYRTRLAGGYYLYDLTYVVRVTHQGTSVTTTENVRLILCQTVDGLKVERMVNY